MCRARLAELLHRIETHLGPHRSMWSSTKLMAAEHNCLRLGHAGFHLQTAASSGRASRPKQPLRDRRRQGEEVEGWDAKLHRPILCCDDRTLKRLRRSE